MLAADHQGCASSFRTGDPFHSRKYLLGTCLPPQNKAAIFVIYFWRTLFCHLLRYSILATITYCSTLQLFFLLPNPHVPIPIHSMAVLRPTPFTNHCAKPPSITFLTPAFGYQPSKTGSTSFLVFPFQLLARPRLSLSADLTS
jgi:hypothetical protein